MTRSLLLAVCLAAAAASAPATTLVHHFTFTANVDSHVGAATTATGTLQGGASISGGALHLNGDAWVDLAPVVPVAADYNASTWTVSIWARSTMPAGQSGTFLSQGAYSGYLPDFSLGVTANADGTGGGFARNRSGWGGGGFGLVAQPGEWNLYTTVMGHTWASLYINGVFQSSAGNGMYPCCFVSQTARIGREVAGFGSQFTGDIDDVRIYSGTLTAEAMLAQYAAGPGVAAAVPEPATALLFALGSAALWLRRRRA